MAQVAQRFDARIAETQSGGDEVNDFIYKTLYAFPWADMLVPAPMMVAILGQLTLVATTADFKLVRPADGFKFVRYPDSFRATIIQLANVGALVLNQSYTNFDEINKRCGAIKPGVNNIIQLLVGDEENTSQENDVAIQRHLPNQIRRLSNTVNACLAKAQETDTLVHDLLKLTMEIHESCTATQGENNAQIKDAELQKTILEEQRKATEEIKKASAEDVKKSREDFESARMQFNNAANSMPTGFELATMQLMDALSHTLSSAGDLITLRVIGQSEATSSAQNRAINTAAGDSSQPGKKTTAVISSDIDDLGYKKAGLLRVQATLLQSLLTSGKDGGIDWNTVKSKDNSGSTFVRVSLGLLLKELEKNISKSKGQAGEATTRAKTFAAQGIEYATALENVGLTPDTRAVDKLCQGISEWAPKVLAFAAEADLKLGTNLVGNSAFVRPDQPAANSRSSAEMAVKSAQYRLSVTDAQLNASRENTRKSSDKLLEVTASLGEIMAQIAGLNVQKIEWDEISRILLRAITFLCALKGCLNNLVHFFDAVNKLVSISLQDTAGEFIQIIKDATEPAPGTVVKSVGSVTLDRWARQTIYNQAISAAKISGLVENISDLYVKLYNGNVHPGVNKLLDMGRLVGSGDQGEIARAGADIQHWANIASGRIRTLVNERLQEYGSDIQSRAKELEQSLGGILPPSPQINAIVDKAKEDQVQEVAKEMDAAADEKPVYRKMGKKLFV